MTITGNVFNIQRFSIHDGPGIRTTVFLKGCPLHCFWCHNPEGVCPKAEVQFFPNRCIMCGMCEEICEHDAHHFQDGVHTYDREQCVTCGECVKECAAGALQMAGEEMTVEKVVEEIMRDRAFYETSHGGVTLSGGEPMLQRHFSHAILTACRAEGISTAIETTASARWEHILEMLQVTDLVMMDLKHMDSDKHRAATGVRNELILANARRLAGETNKPLFFRIPVVPGVNATTEEIGAIGAFVQELTAARRESCAARDEQPAPITLELLPFHRMAGDKYASLGMEYQANSLNTPPRDEMLVLADAARQHSIEVIYR